MRPLILLAAVIAVALAGSTRSAEIKEGPLKADQNIPGSFHPYNVNARVIQPEELEESDREEMDKEKDKEKEEEKYTTKGKYHCLVTEYDLDPVVLLIAKNLDDSAGFKDLLSKLDKAIEKNRIRRLKAFVVFLDENLKDVVIEDDKRTEIVEKLKRIGEDLKLENVVLTLAGYGDAEKGIKSDLAKYEADPSKALTVVLYKTLRIRASYTFTSDELDKADAPAVETILKATAELIKPQ